MTTYELKKQAVDLRRHERVFRVLGGVALGVGLTFGFVVGGEVADGSLNRLDILDDAGILTAAGIGLSLSSSDGRKADVLEADLLRRESQPAPTDTQIY